MHPVACEIGKKISRIRFLPIVFIQQSYFGHSGSSTSGEWYKLHGENIFIHFAFGNGENGRLQIYSVFTGERKRRYSYIIDKNIKISRTVGIKKFHIQRSGLFFLIPELVTEPTFGYSPLNIFHETCLRIFRLDEMIRFRLLLAAYNPINCHGIQPDFFLFFLFNLPPD